jgi:aryl-alcohol dehydrogenase-like predicted oxidoreductase
METRDFGRLGRVSALTLGGGGIAGVWGSTDRAEAVATIHAAVDAGITMLDVAPGYGVDAESERAVGEALRARPAADVMVTTKVHLRDDEEPGRIGRSLRASLERLDEATPEFERLRAEGLIRAWGITAAGHPDSVLAALREAPRPDAAQVVVNALDLSGDMWMFGPETRPANDEIRRAANDNGVAVIGIRAVAAGSLTEALDREVAPDHPAAVDYARAEPFRKLAAELGETPAALAHRHALTVPGVATVVLGVKNRAELAECVAAAARGPLAAEEMRAIDTLRQH